jgi:hypothetical protein
VTVPADSYAVAVAPAPTTYVYAPGYTYAPAYGYDAYAYAPGYTFVDRYRTIAPGRYVVQQTPSVEVPADPAYVVVERTYVVDAPAAPTVVVKRPAKRVVERRTVLRTVAVPAYRNPVYDQDIRGQYVRPISCAIDAYGVERCY